jgi:hypothetical protein
VQGRGVGRKNLKEREGRAGGSVLVGFSSLGRISNDVRNVRIPHAVGVEMACPSPLHLRERSPRGATKLVAPMWAIVNL